MRVQGTRAMKAAVLQLRSQDPSGQRPGASLDDFAGVIEENSYRTVLAQKLGPTPDRKSFGRFPSKVHAYRSPDITVHRGAPGSDARPKTVCPPVDQPV